jgi:hypothetical protein
MLAVVKRQRHGSDRKIKELIWNPTPFAITMRLRFQIGIYGWLGKFRTDLRGIYH